MRALPPAASTSSRLASMLNRQGAASCVTSSRAASTTRLARLALGVMFGVTLNGRLASPCPAVRSGTIQDASDVTTHVHSRLALIERVADPPAAGNAVVGTVAETGHFAAVGAVVDIDVDEPHAAAKSGRQRRSRRRTATRGATRLPGASRAPAREAISRSGAVVSRDAIRQHDPARGFRIMRRISVVRTRRALSDRVAQPYTREVPESLTRWVTPPPGC